MCMGPYVNKTGVDKRLGVLWAYHHPITTGPEIVDSTACMLIAMEQEKEEGS